MSKLVVVFGLSMVALGLVGVIKPALLLRLVGRFQTQAGLYAAMAIRLAMGLALFLAAPESHVPHVFRALGAFVFASGVITPFIGIERVKRIVAWWTARGTVFQRAWGCLALAFGVFILWAIAL